MNLTFALPTSFMYYNFARIHKTMRVTRMMEAGFKSSVKFGGNFGFDLSIISE